MGEQPLGAIASMNRSAGGFCESYCKLDQTGLNQLYILHILQRWPNLPKSLVLHPYVKYESFT